MNITIDVTEQFISQLDQIIRDSVAQAMKDLTMEDRTMDKQETADWFQVSVPTLNLFVREGLPVFQRGQVIRFLYSEVVAWTRNNQTLVEKAKKSA